MSKLVLFVLCLLLIIFISGCTSESPTIASTQSNETPTATQTPTELSLKVGETATTSKLEVTVFSAQKIKSYDYYSSILKENMTQEADPEKTYVLIDAEIKNVGQDSSYAGSSEFSIADSDGYKYDPTLYYGQGTDGMDMIKQLYQNQKMRGKVLFEIPDSATGLKIQYDFGNLLIGTKLASWTME